MNASVSPPEWKPVDSTGSRPTSQHHLPLIGAISSRHALPMGVVTRATFSGCLTACLQHDGRNDAEVAMAIHISAGYMSKFIRSVGEAWAQRLVAFMRETQSIAPLQWIADQMGCDVVARTVSSELAAARARVAELERQARAGA